MAIKLSYKGFSLIETLIIVVIISLLAAIAIPAFIGYKADTEKRQLLSKVNSFYAAVSVCLMDDDIANCSTKKKLGFYCPVGCSDVEAGPIQQGQTIDRLSVLITINDSKACASYTDQAVKDLKMKGVCHNSNGMAGFPLLLCETNAECTAGGFTTCYSAAIDIDQNTKLCI